MQLTPPTAPGAREAEANPSRIECMNILRMEHANGHLLSRVFSLLPFSHIAACSPTCFFVLPEFAQTNMTLLPPVVIVLQQIEMSRFPFLDEVFALTMGKYTMACRCSRRPMNYFGRVVSVACAYRGAICETFLDHARPSSDCKDAQFVSKIPPSYHVGYRLSNHACRRTRRRHSIKAIVG